MALATPHSSLSFPPTHLCSLSSHRMLLHLRLPSGAHRDLARQHLAFRFSASTPRRWRASKSNAEVCGELREFMSSMGLPLNRAPSMNELCENGRTDLANLVRRRGYKVITELLLSSNGVSHSEEILKGKQETEKENLNETAGENNELYQDLTPKVHEQDNQNEIDHLKSLMDQNKLELSQLKRQIEDEKIALSALSAKGTEDLSYMQRLIADKNMELHMAERNLIGLKEVPIDYYTDGQIVEVAGSFNGWQQRIRMDLDPSSGRVSSKPFLWTTILWLYPGVYEIKFVVDGHWRLDPRRKTTCSGSIANNVLTVD